MPQNFSKANELWNNGSLLVALPMQKSTRALARKIRILYVGLKHDYGVPHRGYSNEYLNFLDTLRNMKEVEVEEFAFDEVLRRVGQLEMNRLLLRHVEESQHDLVFFVLFTDEISTDTIKKISQTRTTQTLNWFCDDHWRFESFSRRYAPVLNWSVTTDHDSLAKYKSVGCAGVILSQWACNHFRYRPVKQASDHDLTFVGQTHSVRRNVINFLKRHGIDVECWGKGWQNGRIDFERMLEVFSGSKINLNFAESSVITGWKPAAKIFLNRRADGSIQLNSIRQMRAMIQSVGRKQRPQIKARNFEVPGCGGFLITTDVPGLDDYYVSGKEIVTYRTLDELVEKIRFYMEHDGEREKIRRAGYERTMAEHTYERRFQEIFRTIGLLS